MALVGSIRQSIIQVRYCGYIKTLKPNICYFPWKYDCKIIRQYSQQSLLSNEEKLKEIIDSSNLGTPTKTNESAQVKKSSTISEMPLEMKGNESHFINGLNDEINEKSTIETNTTTRVLDPEEKLPKDTLNTDIKYSNEKFQVFLANLPSHKERLRSDLSKKIDEYLDWIQQALFKATKALNDVTGYSSIEKLKLDVQKLEEQLHREKALVKQCKIKYSEAIKNRSESQKEINELLTRKHNWSPDDLERFTELYRNDHSNELKEQETGKILEEVESSVEGLQLALTQSILARYHEEQIWSDKIRRSSTWGTWILMGINIFLFLLATFIVEPWKRKRLVDSFELKVKEYLKEPDNNNIATPLQIVNPKPINQEQTAIPTVNSNDLSNIKKDNILTEKEIPKSVIISLNLLDKSWKSIKTLLTSNYNIILSEEYDYLSIQKQDLTIIFSIISVSACAIGSLLTLYFT